MTRALAVTVALCSFTLAQNSATNSSTTPPAVATGNADPKTSAGTVPGANSFEAEARNRIESRGYTTSPGSRLI